MKRLAKFKKIFEVASPFGQVNKYILSSNFYNTRTESNWSQSIGEVLTDLTRNPVDIGGQDWMGRKGPSNSTK